MIRLNENEIYWLNRNQSSLNFEGNSSPAAEIYVKHGVNGLAAFHEAIVARDLTKIQQLLDS